MSRRTPNCRRTSLKLRVRAIRRPRSRTRCPDPPRQRRSWPSRTSSARARLPNIAHALIARAGLDLPGRRSRYRSQTPTASSWTGSSWGKTAAAGTMVPTGSLVTLHIGNYAPHPAFIHSPRSRASGGLRVTLAAGTELVHPSGLERPTRRPSRATTACRSTRPTHRGRRTGDWASAARRCRSAAAHALRAGPTTCLAAATTPSARTPGRASGVATPTWVGQPSSVAKRVVERMDAMLSETDVDDRPVAF